MDSLLSSVKNLKYFYSTGNTLGYHSCLNDIISQCQALKMTCTANETNTLTEYVLSLINSNQYFDTLVVGDWTRYYFRSKQFTSGYTRYCNGYLPDIQRLVDNCRFVISTFNGHKLTYKRLRCVYVEAKSTPHGIVFNDFEPRIDIQSQLVVASASVVDIAPVVVDPHGVTRTPFQYTCTLLPNWLTWKNNHLVGVAPNVDAAISLELNIQTEYSSDYHSLTLQANVSLTVAPRLESSFLDGLIREYLLFLASKVSVQDSKGRYVHLKLMIKKHEKVPSFKVDPDAFVTFFIEKYQNETINADILKHALLNSRYIARYKRDGKHYRSLKTCICFYVDTEKGAVVRQDPYLWLDTCEVNQGLLFSIPVHIHDPLLEKGTELNQLNRYSWPWNRAIFSLFRRDVSWEYVRSAVLCRLVCRDHTCLDRMVFVIMSTYD